MPSWCAQGDAGDRHGSPASRRWTRPATARCASPRSRIVERPTPNGDGSPAASPRWAAGQDDLLGSSKPLGRLPSDGEKHVEAESLRSGLRPVAIDELRNLVHGVMPALLIERGLQAATEELVDHADPDGLRRGVMDCCRRTWRARRSSSSPRASTRSTTGCGNACPRRRTPWRSFGRTHRSRPPTRGNGLHQRNFVLLGEVIERVTGQTVEDHLTELIGELGLTNTSYPTGDTLPEPYVTGYYSDGTTPPPAVPRRNGAEPGGRRCAGPHLDRPGHDPVRHRDGHRRQD